MLTAKVNIKDKRVLLLRALKFVCLVFIILNIGIAQGVELYPDLYTGVIASGNEAEPTQKQIARALQQVLERVSGIDNLDQHHDLEVLLRDSDTLIQRFSIVDGPVRGESYFSIVFSSQGITEQLKALGLSIWGKRRPTVLIVEIDIESTEEINILADRNTSEQAIVGLRTHALHRGYHLQLPVADLQELTWAKEAISNSDYLAMGKMLREKYQSDAVLIGIYQHVSLDTAEGNWFMVGELTGWVEPFPWLQDEETSFQAVLHKHESDSSQLPSSSDDSMFHDERGLAVVDSVIDIFYERDTVRSLEGLVAELHIEGINDFLALEQASQLVYSLYRDQAIRLEKMHRGSLVFVVESDSGLNQMREAIDNSNNLQLVSRVKQASARPQIFMRWQDGSTDGN